eukprot:scaffold3651_cov156-Amphora_coffeaeformis.AAC.7
MDDDEYELSWPGLEDDGEDDDMDSGMTFATAKVWIRKTSLTKEALISTMATLEETTIGR